MKLFYILFFSIFAASSLAQRTYRQGVPAALPVNIDNIEWKRDIYREVKLMDNNNAGLGFVENGDNLFIRIFELILSEKIKAYEFSVYGTEVFMPETEIDIRSILKDFQIPFVENDSTHRLFVDDNDMPTEEVLGYYLKESMFYDFTNSMFRVRVSALCPVIYREDDFEESVIKYPMFWVKFDDIEPYLCDLFIYPRANVMQKMAASDYFARNLYHGNIYKVFNVRNFALAQYCENDSLMRKEQMRIEKELKEVKNVTYNTFYRSEVERMRKEDEERRMAEEAKKAKAAEKAAKKANRKPFRFSTITGGVKRFFTE